MATKKPLGLYAGEVEGFAVGDFVDITNGGTGGITKTAGFDNLSPTTTKGDLIVNNGTNNVRVGAGTNGMVLTSDSTQATGVKWGTSSSGTTITGMLKGNGTSIVAAIADTDYTSPTTLATYLQDIEDGYRLADRRIAETSTSFYDKVFANLPGGGAWVYTWDGIQDADGSGVPGWRAITSLRGVSLNGGIVDTTYYPEAVNGVGWAQVVLGYTDTGILKSTFDVARNLNTTRIAVPGTDYATPAQAVPIGGTTGQVLAKTSNTDNAVQWVNSGGGATIVAMDVVLGYDTINSRWKNTDSDTINVTVSGATVGQKVVVVPSGAPSAAGLDQAPYTGMEFDMFACAAYVSATNTIRISAVSIKGILKGSYSIIITFG